MRAGWRKQLPPVCPHHLHITVSHGAQQLLHLSITVTFSHHGNSVCYSDKSAERLTIHYMRPTCYTLQHSLQHCSPQGGGVALPLGVEPVLPPVWPRSPERRCWRRRSAGCCSLTPEGSNWETERRERREGCHNLHIQDASFSPDNFCIFKFTSFEMRKQLLLIPVNL